MPERSTVRTVGGQDFKVTTPDRVFYPATGTTKTDVIDYYLQVADAVIPHLLGRPATRKRWPDGVTGPEFFAKDLELGTPAWLNRVQIRHSSGPKFYPVFETPAALGWLGQVAALELHVPQWRIQAAAPAGTPTATSSTRYPDRIVFDLDPGEGAGLAECAEVALYLRERLGPLGLRSIPVTSGSKGIHLYVPMDDPITSQQATEWARLVAEQVEKAMPALVVSRMTKSVRRNKVLIDWSQNNGKKTTISPYSMRGRERPTVAAPRTWAEIAEPTLEHLNYRDVLARLSEGLDPMADLLKPAMAVAVGAEAPAPPRSRPVSHPPRSRSTTAQPRQRPLVRPAPTAEPAVPSGGLPPDLTGPVRLALAKAENTVPGPRALTGGSLFELKWDGFRACITNGARGTRIWSRQGNELTQSFPEVAAAAAAAMPENSVLDGEVVIWHNGRLDFDLLQRRHAGGPAAIAAQVRQHPASYVAFDLLAVTGTDWRNRLLRDRRSRLEELADGWAPPLHLSPMTDDRDTALAWMADYRKTGVEGLVIKGAGSRYEGGQRRWVKFKSRESTEVLVGAVTGPITRPTSAIAGLYRNGILVIAGRSVPLSAEQSRSLATVLTPATGAHPWPDTIASSRFGNRNDRTTLTKVDPVIVVEVSVDTGMQGGVFRHPLRFLRHRPDMTADDIPHLTWSA